MLNSSCYVGGHGDGIVDAICDDSPSGGMRKRSYFIIFGKGDRTYRKWVESAKVTFTASAVVKQAPVKSSFTEGE